MAKGLLQLDISTAGQRLQKAIARSTKRWKTGGGVVTLDIDSTTIRLLETKGKAIKTWASASLESSEVASKEKASREAQPMGVVVKELMNSSGIKARHITASVSGLYSVSRIVPTPTPAPGSTIEEAFEDLTQDTIPLVEERLYFAWQTISAGEGEPNALLIGVPRDTIDNEVQSLKAVGINPSILELKAIALTRVVNREQALILNTEPASFDIVVVVNSIPEIIRTLPWQPEKLTPEEKAEHLAMTVELTVDFHNARHPNTPLNPKIPLFITGQIPDEAISRDKLEAKSGYLIEPLAPPLEYPTEFPVSQYAVNIGLALRQVTLSEDRRNEGLLPLDINLLPRIYRPWRPSAKQVYTVTSLIAATVMLLPIYQVTSDTMLKTTQLESKFDLFNKQLEQRKLEIAQREPLQKAINNYNTIVNMGGSFTEDLALIQDEADKLGVQVQDVAHQGDKISITCKADSYLIFRNYLTALEESGRFLTPIPPPEGYPYTKAGEIIVDTKTGE
ncbi:MAG: pilus assembly protein PilM [Dehalococcoidia bacterium]|nr:MAG: pilus assembly protein PilM [Dehalococcoidia bacterium]